MSEPSPYLFRKDPELYPSGGLGHGYQIRLRDSGVLLGYVRRVEADASVAHWGFMVYDSDGAKIAHSDQRTTAANFLRRRYDEASR